jgi:His-Xaa-Ser system radical SAM maturase HxsC
MIPLSTYGNAHGITSPIIGKIVSSTEGGPWHSRVFRSTNYREALDARGFEAVICRDFVPAELLPTSPAPLIHGVNTDYLAEGDVVSLDERGHVRTLYRRASKYNALFATDRCNSLCLMCSQPPRAVNDDWRVDEMLQTIRLVDPETPELGISGGEPTLLKEGFLQVVRSCKEHLPATSLHVLSNGRLFRYDEFARQLADIRHHDLMVGIPVYSDVAALHDWVVQARGAFDDTLLGLQNLGRWNVPVEIRVVVHRHTFERLPQLAEFIYRNLTFASHVALMGLEIMGFAIANIDQLWIDPWDYREQLEEATLFLAERGMNVSVYNHQLCTVTPSIWRYCRKSISDWKNDYLPLCDSCTVRGECGGFFTSSLQRKHSAHICAIA